MTNDMDGIVSERRGRGSADEEPSDSQSRASQRAARRTRRREIGVVAEDARVTPIELFLDLVFVFAITQVTTLMSHDLTGIGVVRGLLVLALVWWCWVAYAWLGNVVRADEGVGRVAMFGAMAAVFVFALSVPEAFDDPAGGLTGPVVIAFAYLAVRVLHLAIFLLAARARSDAGLRAQLFRFAPSVLGSTVLLLVASQLHGTAQTWTWVAVVVVDYAGTILAGASGWRLSSAAHFAERHGLIVIIAIGESIIAIGVGVAGLPISLPVLVASVLGLTLAGCLWWAYFDVVALIAERTLRRARGEQRTRLARDAYSYLHLPLVAGIVLMALGLKEVEGRVAEVARTVADELELLPLGAMYAGVATFLLGHAAFAYRAERRVKGYRLVTAGLVLALIPLAAQLPALGALTLLTVVTATMIALESVRFADERDRVRHQSDAAT